MLDHHEYIFITTSTFFQMEEVSWDHHAGVSGFNIQYECICLFVWFLFLETKTNCGVPYEQHQLTSHIQLQAQKRQIKFCVCVVRLPATDLH